MSTHARITLLLIIVIAFSLGLAYEVSLISERSREAADALAKAESVSGSDSFTVAARSMQNDSGGEVATLRAAAITRTELIMLLETLERAGKGMGLEVSVSSITSKAGESSAAPETVQISIESEGSWSGSMAFVRLLGSLPHKAKVVSSNLSLVGRIWQSKNDVAVTVFPENI